MTRPALTFKRRALAALAALAAPLAALAQTPAAPLPPQQPVAPAAEPAPAAPPVAVPRPANEQVIQPAVPRRELRIPQIPSKDFVVGAFAGSYATENFGTGAVYGWKLGYHITEDIFVEGAYAETKVDDENFRQILPGGIFPLAEQTLRYYNLSAGVNVLPGEVFFGRSYARPSALYLIAGIGSTKFLEQRKLTVNYGLGLRGFLRDWIALQVDVRDHVFSLDLLGRRQSTHNLEFSLGATLFF